MKGDGRRSMIIILVYAIGILLCLLMAWNLGANDAANPTDCAVGSGAISMKKAVILFAIFAALGGILLGPFVMKTIDRGIISKEALPEGVMIMGSFAAILAAGLFVALCTWKGMPTSTTHAIIGGVLGFGLIAAPQLVNWDKVFIIFGSLLISPLFAVLVAFGLFYAFRAYFRKPRKKQTDMILSYLLLFALGFAVMLIICQNVFEFSLFESLGVTLLSATILGTLGTFWIHKRYQTPQSGERTDRAGNVKLMSNLLIVALCFSAFAFGANDMANATGAFVTPTMAISGAPTMEVMIILALLGSFGMAVGGLTWGYRVIRTSSFRVTRLDPLTGLAGEYANAFVIFLFTVVPYYLIGFGIPISTTHSSIGAIIGVGIASMGFRGVNKSTVGKILLTWSLTIPVVVVLSAILFGLFNILIPT